MNYRVNPKNGDNLSVLAFGCMRFPSDESLVEKQVAYAIEQGVNYFDTAYIYPGSEVMLGRVLSKGYRDKVKIATKLPHYLVRKSAHIEKFFQTQLERLRTERIDYYMMHMLNDVKDWTRLVDFGIIDWIEEKKRSGQIVNLGFSFHGGKAAFVEIVDAYDWDFCMIQYNYLDEHSQAGKSGLQYAAAKGLPVMIMEPLRGGRLVHKLPKEVSAAFERAPVARPPVEWALRWVFNHPEVTTVLSGMSSIEMIRQNARIASDTLPGSLTLAELSVFDEVRAILMATTRVPCTGCGYCMPCPKGVDIPLCFSCYNDTAVEGKIQARMHYILRTSGRNASLCAQCGKCEAHCPQGIRIREELAAAAGAMEGFLYKPLRFVTSKFMHKS